MLVPWIQENIHVIAKLSKNDVWNKHIQKKEDMFIERDNFKNNSGYCDYSIICHVITKFPESSPDMLKNRITFIP